MNFAPTQLICLKFNENFMSSELTTKPWLLISYCGTNNMAGLQTYGRELCRLYAFYSGKAQTSAIFDVWGAAA
jgi:hypothetical protein